MLLGETQLQFNYSYNNYTTYENLLEYVCLLFPNYNFCPCFHFSNSNNNLINNETFLTQTNDINNKLIISNKNNDKKCYCPNEIKNYFKMNKMKIIELYEKEKKNLNQIGNNMNNINTIHNLENIVYQATYLNNNLQKENDNLNIQIENLNKKINEMQFKNDYEKKIKELEDKNKLIQNNSQVNIENLNKKIKILEASINGDPETMNKLKELGYNIGNIESSQNLIKTGKNNQIIVDNNVYSQTNFMDFYDVIIDIKSIKDINKGWEIKMSEKGLKKYKEYKEMEVIKIADWG